MTFMPINRSQQRADCRRLRDSRSMFDFRGSERTSEIGGGITFSAASHDSIPEDLATCAAEATSRLIASTRLHATQSKSSGGPTSATGRSPMPGYANSSSHFVFARVALARPSRVSLSSHSSPTARNVLLWTIADVILSNFRCADGSTPAAIKVALDLIGRRWME